MKKVLHSPITIEELIEALTDATNHQSPGSDGLPAGVYTRYGLILLPPLLRVLQEAAKMCHLPDSMKEAIILVLPKPGKDRQIPDSYRPISLLNIDVKLLTRVLANRLSGIVGQLVHHNQSGFIPTWSMADNIRRLLLNIQTPVDNRRGRAILSLDAAKAFNSVEWPYLWEMLAGFGLGNAFINWVKVLYSKPRARVRVNNALSLPFKLRRGTRQGCLLSPLLFALAVESLAMLIRNNRDIVGFRRGQLEHKLSFYADDALIYAQTWVARCRP